MDSGAIFAITVFCLALLVFMAIGVSIAKGCKHKWKILGTAPVKFKTQTLGFVSDHSGEIVLEQCELCKEKHAYATDGLSENWTMDFDFANRNYFSNTIKE